MRILVLSFYFRPDLSAGSFRVTALVEALRAAVSADATIEVLTTLPNRYASFSAEAPAQERIDGVTITRIPVGTHQSGMLDQSRSFLTFAREVLRRVNGSRYDVVFATSSRLMTAVLGAEVARRTKSPLYLDIRDIFVDTVKDVLRPPVTWVAKPLFGGMERWAVDRAARVNLVSRGFAGYFQTRYPRQRFSSFTNGIDDEFLAAAPRAATSPRANRPVRVLYAGNVGEGQGLHAILPDLAERMGGRASFVVIGDGGRLPQLREAVEARRLTNIELRPPVGRVELLEEYRAADVLFLHLNDYDAFTRVLPSKLFEYAALGKPVWAGVAGYAAEFVRAEISNAEVFAPCDAAGAVQAFGRLALGDRPRHEFLARFARAQISRELASDVLSIASSGADAPR